MPKSRACWESLVTTDRGFFGRFLNGSLPSGVTRRSSSSNHCKRPGRALPSFQVVVVTEPSQRAGLARRHVGGYASATAGLRSGFLRGKVAIDVEVKATGRRLEVSIGAEAQRVLVYEGWSCTPFLTSANRACRNAPIRRDDRHPLASIRGGGNLCA